MVWLKNIWRFLISPYVWVKEELAYRRKIKELRKKDPFIYK